MRADEVMRGDVLAELSYDPRLEGSHIEVEVIDGAAVLRGRVKSYEQKLAAEAAAQRVRGVRAVAVELHICYPAEAGADDIEIAKRIANLLTWNAALPRGLNAAVDQGWVTLSGTADWHYQRQGAERLIRGLDGVVGVTNDIALKPQPTAADLRERVEAALLRDARIDAQAIRIDVSGSVATLSGQVSALHEREAAEHAAWSAPGISNVTNEIAVK